MAGALIERVHSAAILRMPTPCCVLTLQPPVCHTQKGEGTALRSYYEWTM